MLARHLDKGTKMKLCQWRSWDLSHAHGHREVTMSTAPGPYAPPEATGFIKGQSSHIPCEVKTVAKALIDATCL